MSGKPVGTCFASIDLDSTKMEQGLKRVNDSLMSGSIKVEDAYKSLGIKSDSVFAMQRANAEAAYNFIVNKTMSSSEERVRAEQAMSDKIDALNKQQFGSTSSMLDEMKKSWAMMTTGVAAAFYVINQVTSYADKLIAFGEAGAKVQRIETAFNAVSSAAGLMGPEVVKQLQIASKGMMDESDIMARAGRLIQENIPIGTLTELMTSLTKQAPVVGDTLVEAWDKFGEALSRGNLRAMRSYVGMVDMETEYRKYADSIGVAVIRLSDEQKQAVMAEVVNQRLKDQVKGLGEQTLTASEQIQIAKASIKESHEELSKSAIPITISLYEAWAKLTGLFSQGFKFAMAPGPEDTTTTLIKYMYGIEDEILNVEDDTAIRGVAIFGSSVEKKKTLLKPLTEDQINSVNKMVLESSFYYESDYQAYARVAKAKIDLEYNQNAKLYPEMLTQLGIVKANKYKEIEDKTFQMQAKYNALHLTDDQDTLVQETLMLQDSAEKQKGIRDATFGYDQKKDQEYIRNHSDTMKEQMAMVEALSGFEGRSVEELDRLKAEWDNKYAKERWRIDRKLADDIAKFTGDEFEAQKANLDDQYKIYQKLGTDKHLLDIWYYTQLKTLQEKNSLVQEDFWAGMKTAYDQDIRNQFHWGQQGSDIWNSLFGKSGALESVTQTFFVDLFQGKLKTAGDYFNSFKDLILAAIAKIIAQWLVFQAMVTAGNYLFGGTGDLQTKNPITGITGAATNAAVNYGVNSATGGGGGGGTGGGLIGAGTTAVSSYIATNFPTIASYLGITSAAPAAPTGLIATGATAAEVGPEAYYAAEAASYGVEAAAGGSAAAGTMGMVSAAAPYLAFAGLAAFIGMNAYEASTRPELWPMIFNPGQLEGMAAVMANGGAAANPPGPIEAEMYADPFFNPTNLWNMFVQAFGRSPTSDEASGLNDTAPMFFYRQPTFQKYVKEIQDYWKANDVNPNVEAYLRATGIDPWANMGGAGAAEGAMITEPMLAIGKSGKRLWIGEKGTEYVGPIKGQEEIPRSQGETHYHYQLNFNGPIFAEKQHIANVILPELRKLERYGH